jgi:hypothetical protein
MTRAARLEALLLALADHDRTGEGLTRLRLHELTAGSVTRGTVDLAYQDGHVDRVDYFDPPTWTLSDSGRRRAIELIDAGVSLSNHAATSEARLRLVHPEGGPP